MKQVKMVRITKPKRALSAYNLFYRYERARILGSRGFKSEIASEGQAKRRRHRKTHGVMGFKEMTKCIADKWAALDEKEKSVFQKQALEHRKIYRKEMIAYNRALANQVSRRSKELSRVALPTTASQSKPDPCQPAKQLLPSETFVKCRQSEIDCPVADLEKEKESKLHKTQCVRFPHETSGESLVPMKSVSIASTDGSNSRIAATDWRLHRQVDGKTSIAFPGVEATEVRKKRKYVASLANQDSLSYELKQDMLPIVESSNQPDTCQPAKQTPFSKAVVKSTQSEMCSPVANFRKGEESKLHSTQYGRFQQETLGEVFAPVKNTSNPSMRDSLMRSNPKSASATDRKLLLHAEAKSDIASPGMVATENWSSFAANVGLAAGTNFDVNRVMARALDDAMENHYLQQITEAAYWRYVQRASGANDLLLPQPTRGIAQRLLQENGYQPPRHMYSADRILLQRGELAPISALNALELDLLMSRSTMPLYEHPPHGNLVQPSALASIRTGFLGENLNFRDQSLLNQLASRHT